MTPEDYQLPAHGLVPEPNLLFHPERSEDTDPHPLIGLVNYGPYSRSLVGRVMDPIRVATLGPQQGTRQALKGLLSELEQKHQPKERRQYLIEFPGFSRVFGLRVCGASQVAHRRLPDSFDAELEASPQPHLLLAERLTQAISSLLACRADFDVLLIYLPAAWERAFYGAAGEDFDLHDYIKGMAASVGIPTQLLQQDSVLAYFCRASVMWRLSIALYCKAGGVPWKLADSEPETAYVGLSYAMRSQESDKPKFVTCCSQVFDADGAGLEFLAYETEGVRISRDNPFLDRPEMRRVMARSLALYQKRHAGRQPQRVVIHKSTEFKNEELDGCFDAWQASEGLEAITVQQDVGWRGIRIDEPGSQQSKGVPAGYPCMRGSYLQLSGRDCLLWTQGDAPSAVGGKNFYKEGKSIPSPLLLRRFAGHGPFDTNCREVLGLSKMNWNNDGLYDRLPVTQAYAKVLANIVKRIPRLAQKPYELCYFM